MSTQAKALPDNLDALYQREDFKKVNADETIKTLKTKLDDADVAYTSADDKAELVWRWMAYQGVDFSVETEAAPEAKDVDTESKTNDRIKRRNQKMVERRQQSAPYFQNQSRIDRGIITASADEQILVTNTGQYDVFEPASRTVIKSGKTVTIKPMITASIKQITANIRQINSLRGDVLKIKE